MLGLACVLLRECLCLLLLGEPLGKSVGYAIRFEQVRVCGRVGVCVRVGSNETCIKNFLKVLYI